MGGPTSGMGVSLWLVPEGPARELLSGCIHRLAERLGTVPFAPHVTLLAGIEAGEEVALAEAEALARTLAPLPVRLAGVEGRDARFRCLYVRAEHPAALAAAHAVAARWFSRDPDPSFEPHLSLVYGTLEPEAKAGLARELDAATRVSFEVRRLHLWRTAGEPEEWSEIGAFGLGGGSD